MEGLAELHTHLGGSVSSDILWSLAHRQGIALPVKDFWDFDRLVTVSDPRGVPDLDALDGILIGAGDTRFLMWSMLAASALFVTLAALSLAFGLGVVGVWIALDVLIAARLALLGPRFLSRRWVTLGWA